MMGAGEASVKHLERGWREAGSGSSGVATRDLARVQRRGGCAPAGSGDPDPAL